MTKPSSKETVVKGESNVGTARFNHCFNCPLPDHDLALSKALTGSRLGLEDNLKRVKIPPTTFKNIKGPVV